MRKLFNFFAVALVMLAAVSCEKNEVLPDNNSEGKVVTLKASINNGGTKTSLRGEKGDDDKYPVLWSEGDQIAVVQRLSGDDTRIFQFTLSEGKNTANGTFTCNSAGNFDPSELFEALYPYNAIENLVIPQNQNYAEKSFGQGAMIMYAKNTNGGNSLVFDNTLGVLKLTLKGVADEEVSSIELNASAPICGNAEIIGNLGESKRLAINTENASFYANNIILSCPNIPIEEYEDFLIALPQGNYNFSVTINTNKGVYYKSTTNKTVTASNILKMADLNLEGFANKMSYVENGVYLGEGVALPAGENKTIIWAPVNCGYDAVNFKYGKLYQWGRKDGQGYYFSETFANNDVGGKPWYEDEVGEVGPISWESYIAGNYSNVFIKNKVTSDQVRDWLSPQNPDLWGNGTKTDHDPCPAGWRVPTSDEMKSLSSGFSPSENNPGASGKNTAEFESDRGYYFYGVTDESDEASNKVFFPASGELLPNGECGIWTEYDEDKDLYVNHSNRGYIGYYWTSTTNNTNSYFLMLGKAYEEDTWNHKLKINNFGRRASGYSVRCVKDMTQSQSMPVSN